MNLLQYHVLHYTSGIDGAGVGLKDSCGDGPMDGIHDGEAIVDGGSVGSGDGADEGFMDGTLEGA